MSNLSQTLSQLSPEKRALLEARLFKKAAERNEVELPAKTSGAELSFAQQSMWFLDRLEPNSSFYSIPQAIRITGPLNIAALQKSFATVVARHEVLRTQIVAVDGQPQPRIAAVNSFALPVTKVERENVQRLANEEAQKPFDLENDLMLRAKILQLSDQEHILLLTVHHIASDLWSFSVLYRELEQLYESFVRNSPVTLSPLKFQYSDFARTQRQFLQSEKSREQIAFWKSELSGELSELNLPIDHPRPKTQRYRGARKSLRVDSGLTNRIRNLSRDENVTPYVTLLAAFQSLLHRYSAQDDIIIGTPIGGRNQIETENLIGYFLNTVPLRTDLSGEPTFTEMLRRAQKVVLNAFAHRDIPFEKLVDELRIERNGNQNPVFQTIFQFQPSGVPQLNLHGTQTELLESETGTSKMDLVFTLAEDANGFTGNIEYNTDLFETATIERWLAHYVRLLESAVTNPEEKISRLNILTESERKQLSDWNQTKTAYPRDKCIHQLFEEQAEKTPDAVALIFGSEQLTYRELNQRADELGRHLKSCGVKPESRIGICLDRSIELIVGLIAILKAGGAYVPLDANLPEERLQFMLTDTAVTLLITDKDFPAGNVRKIHPQDVSIGKNGSVFSEKSSSPENLAYVMFTSGSTGKPKGVAIPHRAVVRLVKETNFMSFGSEEVFLQFAPVSFDASTLEIWGSLLNGARLVIHPPHLPSLEELGETLRQNKITTLWLTSGLFHQMVEHQLDSLRGIKQLLAGGDILSVPHVRKVLEHLPECQLINGYGPTENTTFTCCFAVPQNWNGDRSVPIGKPISNTQVYILDQHLQAVPIGVPGELFIGGDGLARGYLNAPELNAEKFIPNPFHPAERLYTTGDRARWLADGNIEFLGRLDHQVKLRGFRIELGEIEAALSEHPLIRQCVAITRESPSAGKYLAAYFTTQPNASLDPTELRAFLEQKLPGYMVPSHFVSLKELPLTTNGKVDRRRLPAPEEIGAKPSPAFVSPRSETEQKLFDIWKEILGRRDFGVHENFFQLGGHSLLATRVGSRITKQFQIQFSLNLIFQHPTIAGLARAVDNAPRGNAANEPQLIRRKPRPETKPAPPKNNVLFNKESDALAATPGH